MAVKFSPASRCQKYRSGLAHDGEYFSKLTQRGHQANMFIQGDVRPSATGYTLSMPTFINRSWYTRGYKRAGLQGVIGRLFSHLASLIASSTRLLLATDKYIDLSEAEPKEHHTMSMIMAISTLHGKENLMTSDRLSIFANLTGYEYHLDVEALVKAHPTISFSACALALSFANGDLGWLTDPFIFSQPSTPEASCPSWLPPSKPMDVLETLRPYVRNKLATIGNPCVVVDGTLVLRGIVWDVQMCNDLTPLQSIIQDHLKTCQENPSAATDIGKIVLKATLQHLLQQGNEEVA
ncbi:hypothetical protein B0I35DRAFT_45390 [Stachybotrys elegans]|uniref:Uncharacterized protein n=1 Tax=Stachybotrys elegans TaxID=80388 RepID=A0A8K0WZ19_9HYPO|nr:hypothetical protein B0I35DRAFT_45390 [Stachybotrys elegans]